MWPNSQFPVDLVTFTEEILNGRLNFLCSENDVDDVKFGLICNMIKLRVTKSIYTSRRNSTKVFRRVLRINSHDNLVKLKNIFLAS